MKTSFGNPGFFTSLVKGSFVDINMCVMKYYLIYSFFSIFLNLLNQNLQKIKRNSNSFKFWAL